MRTTTSTEPVIDRPIALITRDAASGGGRRLRLGPQPARPVPHHAGLAERERDEDADDVELDQRVTWASNAMISRLAARPGR
jgi:hypothetical protein